MKLQIKFVDFTRHLIFSNLYADILGVIDGIMDVGSK